MRKTILVDALLLAASPAIAQVGTTNGQQQLGVQVPSHRRNHQRPALSATRRPRRRSALFSPARTPVATNRVADQDRAAAPEAPRRRRPSRLAGRNGRPANYDLPSGCVSRHKAVATPSGSTPTFAHSPPTNTSLLRSATIRQSRL